MTTMSGAIAAGSSAQQQYQGGKVARVYEGWSDAQILALLRLFRTRVLEYVYGGAERFAASVATHFPGTHVRLRLHMHSRACEDVQQLASVAALLTGWTLVYMYFHVHAVAKSESDITEMMRALMSQFALAIDTKAFNNEGAYKQPLASTLHTTRRLRCNVLAHAFASRERRWPDRRCASALVRDDCEFGREQSRRCVAPGPTALVL